MRNRAGRKKKQLGRYLCPWEGTQRKGRWHGWRSSLGSEQFEPHIGRLSSGVRQREDETPWLVGGLVVLTEGLREAWTPLMRSVGMLACSQSRAERADWDHTAGWLVFRDHLSVHPSLSWPNTPALFALHCNSTWEHRQPQPRKKLSYEMLWQLKP